MLARILCNGAGGRKTNDYAKLKRGVNPHVHCIAATLRLLAIGGYLRCAGQSTGCVIGARRNLPFIYLL